MKNSLLEVGGICAEWKVTTGKTPFAETGDCDNSMGSMLSPERDVMGLFLFQQADDLRSNLKGTYETYLLIPEEIRELDYIYLIGDDWLISAYESNQNSLEVFENSFGGIFVESLEELSVFLGLETDSSATSSSVDEAMVTEIVGSIMPILEQNGTVDEDCVIAVVRSLSADQIDQIGRNESGAMAEFLVGLEGCY